MSSNHTHWLRLALGLALKPVQGGGFHLHRPKHHPPVAKCIYSDIKHYKTRCFFRTTEHATGSSTQNRSLAGRCLACAARCRPSFLSHIINCSTIIMAKPQLKQHVFAPNKSLSLQLVCFNPTPLQMRVRPTSL